MAGDHVEEILYGEMSVYEGEYKVRENEKWDQPDVM
jgi:hypothetical protein